MSMPHAASGELFEINPHPQGAEGNDSGSKTLVRAEHLEVFRMALPAGKATPMHRAAGAITIQCLAGQVELEAHGQQQLLRPGLMVYLADAEPHAVRALEDAVLLITVLLRRL